MNGARFDAWIRAAGGSRRSLLGGILTLAGGPLTLLSAEAKKKRKRKKHKRHRGRPRTPGNICRTQLCLNAPFTIEALGTQPLDGATYLFVPPQDAATGPAPYIEYICNRDDYPCEREYPFACVDGFKIGDVAEVTTISRLLPGRYEYWLEVPGGTPAGAVTVILNDNSRDVQQWTNPAPDSPDRFGWHVFDIDGANGRVIAIDTVIDDAGLPETAHDPRTYVCPPNT